MLRLWNPISLEIIKSVSFHKSKINSIDIKNHFAVSGSSDKSIGLWKLPDLKLGTCFLGHTGQVLTVKMCGNSHFVSGSTDKTVKIWHIKNKTLIFEIYINSIVNCMIIPKDLKFLLIFSGDGNIIHLEIDSKMKSVKKIHNSRIDCCLALDEDITLLLTGHLDGSIVVYNRKTSTIKKIIQAHSNNVNSIDLCKNNNIVASGSLDSTVKLWKTETFELLETLSSFSASIFSICFVDSKLYISGAASKIFLFNTNLNSIVNVTKMKPFFYNCFAISVKCGFVAYGWGEISLFDLNSNSEICKKSFFTSVECFSFSGSKIFCGTNEGTLILLTTPDLRIIWKNSVNKEFVYFVLGSKNLKTVAYSTQHKFYIITRKNCKVICTHSYRVHSGKFIESNNSFVFIDVNNNIYISKNCQTTVKIANVYSSFQIFVSYNGQHVIVRKISSEFALIETESKRIKNINQEDIKTKKHGCKYPQELLSLSLLRYSYRL